MAATEQRCPDTGSIRRRVSIKFEEPTLTEQNHKASCDINNILARYTKTGVLEHVREYEGQYADITVTDFHDAMNKVAAAKSMFEELPSQLRAHFRNDTSEFIDFCNKVDKPEQALSAIAEEYRREALGLDVVTTETKAKNISGRDAAQRDRPKTSDGSDGEGQTESDDS